MLLTLLLWHLTATAALLAVYVLVVGLQWSAARLSGAAPPRRRAARPPCVAVPAAQPEDVAAVPLSSAA